MTLTCRIFLKIIIFFIKIHTARQQCGRRICVYVTDSLQFPVIYLISHYFQSRYLISRDFLLLKENKSTIPLKNVLLHISLFFFKFHEYFHVSLRNLISTICFRSVSNANCTISNIYLTFSICIQIHYAKMMKIERIPPSHHPIFVLISLEFIPFHLCVLYSNAKCSLHTMANNRKLI